MCKDVIYEAVEGNKKLKIYQDSCEDSPRDWDNLGTMVCFHKRYDLGDKNHGFISGNYNSWDELEKDIIRKNGDCIILPIYMYDHSGITISTGRNYPYNDCWDAGQVGFIFVSKKKVREEYSWKVITKKRKEKIEKYLNSEVKAYDQFLTGDVYGYEVVEIEKDEDGDEVEGKDLDSCWGFYGTDFKENGLLESAGFSKEVKVERSYC